MKRTALITGGSRGLGLALTRHLARSAWTVVIDGRDADAVASAAETIRSTTPSADVRAVPGDVSDPRHRNRLAVEVESTGRLDVLVNNASILGPSPQPRLAGYPLDVLLDVYRTNVLAPLGLIQLTLPMLTGAHGAIIDVTSDAAVEAYEGWGGYGSSKAALDQLTRILAAELPGLDVYAFDPGDMRTRMHQDAFPGEDISDRPDPETVVPSIDHLITERPPSGRYRAADLMEAAR
jgi:NAD(P)-dependent dehydrogenase (short-subunit alcohol dehydrogenase family)